MRSMGLAVLATLAATAGAGCDVTTQGVGGVTVSTGGGPDVKGNGVIKDQAREVPSFHALRVDSIFEATVEVGPTASVTLSMDENLLELAKTEVVDGRLTVRFEDNHNIQSTRTPKVTIVVPTLDALQTSGIAKISAKLGGRPKTLRIKAEGASKVEAGGLAADLVEVEVAGSSRVTLEGEATRLTLDVSGASNGDASTMKAKSVEVEVGGASHAEAQASDAIRGEVSGAGSLKILGSPKSRAVKTSGAGSVSG